MRRQDYDPINLKHSDAVPEVPRSYAKELSSLINIRGTVTQTLSTGLLLD
jgi:hypothetical protein